MFTDIYNTSNVYDLIYSDPAWPQKKGNIRACRPNQTKELDYHTCSLEEIYQIHKTAFNLLTDKSNVFIWTIDKFLPETEEMMHKLSFTLHARLVWNKENGVAPAFTVRFTHEYLLWFYKKGHMLMPAKNTRGKYTTVITEPSTVHSRKPNVVYEMLDDMFPDAKKLELFARNTKKNWDCWGNQTNMFGEV